MNFKTFQCLIFVVMTSCAISYETSNGSDDFRGSDSDESNELRDKQTTFRNFWQISKGRHSGSREWPESHEPHHHFSHSQNSQGWQDSHESAHSKKHRKPHQSKLHGSIEFQKWEDLTPSPSIWERPPPWLSCPSLTYHLQCEPGEKLNCHKDSDCGYSQKCCPIVGGGVMGRPLQCCRSYTRPSWWWPTDSPHKPCPHHQTTGTPTYWTTTAPDATTYSSTTATTVPTYASTTAPTTATTAPTYATTTPTEAPTYSTTAWWWWHPTTTGILEMFTTSIPTVPNPPPS